MLFIPQASINRHQVSIMGGTINNNKQAILLLELILVRLDSHCSSFFASIFRSHIGEFFSITQLYHISLFLFFLSFIIYNALESHCQRGINQSPSPINQLPKSTNTIITRLLFLVAASIELLFCVLVFFFFIFSLFFPFYLCAKLLTYTDLSEKNILLHLFIFCTYNLLPFIRIVVCIEIKIKN